MNLKSLVAVSRAITAAAIAREDSRGAHFRSDFPEAGPLETSAFTSIRLRGNGEIASAKIVFCNEAATRDTTVVHEVGHTFGMGHSPDAREIMHAFKMGGQPDGFGARESLVMRLMLQRRGGNRYPDDDRNVTAAREREVVIVCGP